MSISSANAPAVPVSKTRKVVTLTSGTSYTVPAGVTFLNVTLIGGGGGGAGSNNNTYAVPQPGLGGQMVSSTLSATAGASITYAIGAGGSGGANGGDGSSGGTTTFTGATSASGGNGGAAFNTGKTGTSYLSANNGGGAAGGATGTGGAGGSGCIIVEYWV